MKKEIERVAPRSFAQFKIGPSFSNTCIFNCIVNELNEELKYDLKVRTDRGVHFQDSSWVAFKRNYFSLVASFELTDPSLYDEFIYHKYYLKEDNESIREIKRFEIGIKAIVSNPLRQVTLNEHSAKRDAETKKVASSYPVIASRLPSHLEVINSINSFKSNSELFIFEKEPILFTPAFNLLDNYSKDKPILRVAKYDRLQFSQSTQKNESFKVIVQLCGILEDESNIVLAISESPDLYILGRANNAFVTPILPKEDNNNDENNEKDTKSVRSSKKKGTEKNKEVSKSKKPENEPMALAFQNLKVKQKGRLKGKDNEKFKDKGKVKESMWKNKSSKETKKPLKEIDEPQNELLGSIDKNTNVVITRQGHAKLIVTIKFKLFRPSFLEPVFDPATVPITEGVTDTVSVVESLSERITNTIKQIQSIQTSRDSLFSSTESDILVPLKNRSVSSNEKTSLPSLKALTNKLSLESPFITYPRRRPNEPLYPSVIMDRGVTHLDHYSLSSDKSHGTAFVGRQVDSSTSDFGLKALDQLKSRLYIEFTKYNQLPPPSSMIPMGTTKPSIFHSFRPFTSEIFSITTSRSSTGSGVFIFGSRS